MTQTLVQLRSRGAGKAGEEAALARRRVYHRTAWECAIVSGIFCWLVTALMAVNLMLDKRTSPLTDKQIDGLKAQLTKDPGNEALKERIRRIDLAMREDYFRRRDFLVHGAYLLLAGGIALAASLRLAFRFAKQPYLPAPADANAPPPARLVAMNRWAIGLGGAVLGLTLAVLAGAAFIKRNPLDPGRMLVGPTTQAATGPAVAIQVPTALPSRQQLLANWPAFRGVDGNGVADVSGGSFPTSWDGPAGRNVIWKVPVPLPGKNSPVVWEDLVFLAGANAAQREVLCFSAASGEILWRQKVPYTVTLQKVYDDTGHAPSTVATDGIRVYAIFPTGDLVCFDIAGKKLWSKAFGLPHNAYGHAASLRMAGDKLIVLMDQGEEKENLSAILAFEGATGKQLWRTPRPMGESWTTPTLAWHETAPQIITAAKPLVVAYDAATGQEIWQAKVLRGDVAPSPVVAGGMIFVANEGADTVAINAGGKGDITKTHVAWKSSDGLPDIVSPLATGQFLLTVQTSGLAICYDAATGKPAWEQDLEAPVNASPTLAGQHIHVSDLKGVTRVIEASRTFKQIAANPLGEEIGASPALVRGRIYIRGKDSLWCIGNKP